MNSILMIASVFFFSLIAMTERWGKLFSFIGLAIWLYTLTIWLMAFHFLVNDAIDYMEVLTISFGMLVFIIVSLVISVKNITYFYAERKIRYLTKDERNVATISIFIFIICVGLLILMFFCM